MQLIKEGAADYIAKPWDDEKLVAHGARTWCSLRELRRRTRACARRRARRGATLAGTHDLRGVVYAATPMHERGPPGGAASPPPTRRS